MTTHLALDLKIEALDVVIVEDSKPMRMLMRTMLSAFGVTHVRGFDTATEALEAMLAEPPTLVIADWRMPTTNGMQLLKALRRKGLDPLCFVPFVMVSAYGTRTLVEESFRAGAHYFLVKPVSPSQLHKTLKRVVADRRPFRLEGVSYVIDGIAERLDRLQVGERTAQRANTYRGAAAEAALEMPDELGLTDMPPAVAERPRASAYGAVTEIDA